MRALALLLIAVMLVACGPEQTGPQEAEMIPVSAELDPETAAWLAEATNAFGFDLLSELDDDGGNVMVSPTSVAVVLTMILNGARGQTWDDLATVLHVDDRNEADINTAYATLLASLEGTDEVELTIANSQWADAGTPFEPAYLQRVRAGFSATVDEVDLGAPDAAERIDGWVRQETRDLIDGIARDLDLPNPLAVLVLLNATYFKGDWTTPFDPARTYDGQFTRPDGSTVTVPMMSRDGTVARGRGDGFEIVRLPYGDGRFSIEVILPAGPLDALRIDAERWAAATDTLAEERLLLALPRFDLEYSATLSDALAALGMSGAFGGESDFTRMSPANPFLSTVAHKTHVRVDEEGTEAAAVTGGVMAVSAPMEQVIVDRPFLFTISDTETGAIVFLGAVTDPTA